MNGLIQMLMQNKLQKIPQQMMGQLEQQLKRTSPQAYQKYQEAKKNNNPNDLLNETINGFNPNQRQEWDNMMNMFNNNISAK